MTTKQSIERVLSGRRKPMSVGEIFEQAFPLTTGLKGRTPKQTYYSILYGEAKRPDGLVTKVDGEGFKLNPQRRSSGARA